MIDRESPNSWIDSTEHFVVVTGREYELVKDALKIEEDLLKPDMKILSVGEGLSNYGRVLGQKYNLDVIALDPIYSAGIELFSEDPAKVTAVLGKKFKGVVDYRNLWSKDPDRVPLPDQARAIAASVYELPFIDEAFDLALSYKLFEHADFGRMIAQMVRVLKPGGEIRVGGCMLDVVPERNTLLPYNLKYHGKSSYYHARGKGVEDGLQWLLQQDSLAVYVSTDGLPKRSEVRDRGHYVAGLLIVRKDNQVPGVSPVPETEQYCETYTHQGEQRKHYPFLGRLWKINEAVTNHNALTKMTRVTFNISEVA